MKNPRFWVALLGQAACVSALPITTGFVCKVTKMPMPVTSIIVVLMAFANTHMFASALWPDWLLCWVETGSTKFDAVIWVSAAEGVVIPRGAAFSAVEPGVTFVSLHDAEVGERGRVKVFLEAR